MVATIDFRVDPTTYAYLQMAEHLKARIESGELEHHRPLPAERRLGGSVRGVAGYRPPCDRGTAPARFGLHLT